MPLRDDRRGRRATLSPGSAPLRPEFSPIGKSIGLIPSAAADAVVAETADGESGTFRKPEGASEAAHLAIAKCDSFGIAATEAARADTVSEAIRAVSASEAARDDIVSEADRADSASEAIRAVSASEADRVHTASEADRVHIASDAARDDVREVTRQNDGGKAVHFESFEYAREDRVDGSPFEVSSTAIDAADTTIDVSPRRTLLEPSAVLMAIARPFLAAARFARKPIVDRKHYDTTESFSEPDFESKVFAECSFANEVESLLRAPDEIDNRHAEPMRDEETAPAAESSALRTLVSQHEAATNEPPAEQNIVVGSVPARFERVVPLTRLPLRPQGFDITWTAGISGFEHAGSQTRTARHRQLERYIRDPGTISSETIARAYHEEDGDGRTIALRVLLRNFPEAGRGAFVEALRVGSDEERAIAVDGLSASEARDELTGAFTDRVDAIAAKAALAYVGTLKRADFAAVLAAYVDETQIEKILRLLAGIVE